MANHKLLLDDEVAETAAIIAIHCSEEAYKVAYLLNHTCGLRLKRRKVDLDFSHEGLEITFPIFKFEAAEQYNTYYLVANKCKSSTALLVSSSGLFEQDSSQDTVTTYLLSEQKQVDYFLKIETDYPTVPIKNILASLNEINQVISAYKLDFETLKNKNNLIFD